MLQVSCEYCQRIGKAKDLAEHWKYVINSLFCVRMDINIQYKEKIWAHIKKCITFEMLCSFEGLDSEIFFAVITYYTEEIYQNTMSKN